MRLLQLQPHGDICINPRYLDESKIPPYAILSHTWGDQDEEVTFENLTEGTGHHKEGYKKIRLCGEQADKDGLQYFWVDSCCIRKTSDLEVSASIRSMFRWYQRAAKCYVYLADVSTKKRKHEEDSEGWHNSFRRSRWFTRGWTLQELLAPTSVEFFSCEWNRVGDRKSLLAPISCITGIPPQALEGKPLWHFSVMERRNWAANRMTAIPEDIAYCLMGIFDICMMPRYGEGKEKACERLNSRVDKLINGVAMDSIVQWLSPPDPSSNYERALKQRQVGTGRWLLHDERYLKWRAGWSSFLWLYGIPGCGKTILSSTVLEDILSMVNDSTKAVAAYYYFSFDDGQKQIPHLMVRSILAQLLRQCANIPTAVADFFSCARRQQEPSLNACLDILRQIIDELPCTYLILDALDESKCRRTLIEIIASILTWKLHNLFILVTSRKERDIEDALTRIIDSKGMIQLQSHHIDLDIRLYINGRLSVDKKLEKWRRDNKIKEEVETVLTQKAHGTFRWAACELDELSKCRNRAELRKSLSTLPSTLDETYERMVCAISKQDAVYAFRVLRWLSFSERPLLLEEIAEIVAIDPEREDPFDQNEIFEDPLEVLDICSSLVSITRVSHKDGPKQTGVGQGVVLAHYSVQEYLTSKRYMNNQASRNTMDEAICHTLISECCLSSLLLSYSRKHERRQGNMGLERYSAQFWIQHGKKGKMNDRWTRKATSLCSNSTAVAHWTRIYDPDQPWADYEKVRDERLAERPQGLYYASLAGLFDVAVQLIERWNANVNAKGIGFYDNALRAASACGHERVVELLLGAGAEVNATGGGVFHNALQVASSRGHERVVELLLRAGANVNAKGDYFSGGFAALHYASDRGHKRVVELLLGAGADVDAKGHQFNGSSTALQYASTRGHEGVVKLLLDQGKIKQAMNAGDHQDSEGEQGPKEAQLMGLGKPQQTQEERETKVEHRLQISQAQH